MKCHSSRVIAIFLVAATAVIVWTVWQQRRTEESRVEDVRKLVRLHAEYGFTNVEISNLIALAQRRGIRIANPLAKDRNQPSYRIVANAATNLLNVVVEESPNVTDRSKIVRGYADGHVSIERRP